MKPNVVLAPAASVPLYPALDADTVLPEVVTVVRAARPSSRARYFR